MAHMGSLWPRLAELPLAGEWTLAGFCDHLATLDPFVLRAGLRPVLHSLENRCGPFGPPTVRIPPPPLDGAKFATDAGLRRA